MKAEDQSAERDLFEKWAREQFVCHEYSFAIAQPYGYINTIQSQTFDGRVNAQYADVQMLWLTWRGARAALSAREAPAREQQEALIDAAEKHAANYNDDTREAIKTDVLNAFYAGAKWREVAAPPAAKAVEMDADKLHVAILNLPPKDTESGWHSDTTRQAYRVGFYAACRAAAELVLAALSKQAGNHG